MQEIFIKRNTQIDRSMISQWPDRQTDPSGAPSRSKPGAKPNQAGRQAKPSQTKFIFGGFE
jgi:hypothetical protein